MTYSIRDIRQRPAPRTRDPLVELARADRDLVIPLESVEDEVAEYYDGSPLRCVGYWRTARVSPHRAAVELLDQMTSLLSGHAAMSNDEPLTPEPVDSLLLLANADATAAASELVRLGAARHVTVETAADVLSRIEPAGAVRSKKSSAAERAPRQRLTTFDAIFWIEGPSACSAELLPDNRPEETDEAAPNRGRQRALAAMRDRLAPGGQLIVADIVGYPLDQPELWTSAAASLSGEARRVAYQQDLEAAGYREATVRDITKKSWLRFFEHSRRYFLLKHMFNLIDEDRCRDVLAALPGGQRAVDAYILARAVRP